MCCVSTVKAVAVQENKRRGVEGVFLPRLKSGASADEMKKNEQHGPPKIWDKLSVDEKKHLQECLNDLELEFGANSGDPLNSILMELKEKYNVHSKCMYCGRQHRGAYGLCKSCKTQLIRSKNVDMGENEIAKFSAAMNPDNLHWAFVDLETAQRIAKLFSPGKKLSWAKMQPIGDAFAQQKTKIEESMGVKEHRHCLVCGNLNRSSRGLCSECRAYIREHGCTKPMREGDYKANSGMVEAFSQFTRLGATGNDQLEDELYPLVKVR